MPQPEIKNEAGRFTLLAPQGKEAEIWLSLLRLLPASLRDIHYRPDYCEIYERTYGAQARLVVWHHEETTIIQPVLIRPLTEDRELNTLLVKDKADIENVYGYGGPLCVEGAPDERTGRRYQEDLTGLAAENGWVSEYCLLHPYSTGHQLPLLTAPLTPFYRKEVLTIDLRLPLEFLWSDIEERQRKAIAIARRRDVKVKREALTADILAVFQKSYLDTMQRKEAGELWHFPDNYFANCRDCLGEEHVALFNAYCENTVVASFFMLMHYNTVYYHFSASDPSYAKLNAPALLLFDTMVWAKSEGFHHYHLGGGRTDTNADALYRFKESFSGISVPLYAYKRVFDRDTYDTLSEQKKISERQNLGHEVESAFFPLYRRPTH